MSGDFLYDVAVSFAGEDRRFVYEVVKVVQDAGYSVFYDEDNQVAMWGQDLTEYLSLVYEKQSRYTVMFVSKDYAAKPWTRLERRSALVRALNQETAYLLPVQLDDVELPGVLPTIAYLPAEPLGSAGIARAIIEKLQGCAAARGSQFNGSVPRNADEATLVLGERPAGWEPIIFAYEMVRGIENLDDRYRDHRLRYAQPSTYVARADLDATLHREGANLSAVVRNFGHVLTEEAQMEAFGPPGEPGNLDAIIHLANRYVDVYRAFLDWATRLRGYTTDNEDEYAVLAALAGYADNPIEQMREFAYEFRDDADTLHERLVRGTDVLIGKTLDLDVSPEAVNRFKQARRDLK